MTKLSKLIEEFGLEKESSHRAARAILKGQRRAFWPSEASIRVMDMVFGKCHRAMWWDFKNMPVTNPIDARGLRTVRSGLEFEERNNIDLKEMGVWDVKLNAQKKFFDEDLNVSGEVDTFARIDEEVYGVEYKTIYGYWARKEVFVLRRPKIEALMQVMLYMKHFNLPFRLIYGTRDSQEVTEFELTFDKHGLLKIDGKDFWLCPLELKQLTNRFDIFKTALDKDEIPDRDYPVLGWTREQLEMFAKMKMLGRGDSDALKAGRTPIKVPWQCTFCRYFYRCRAEAQRETGQKPTEDLVVPMGKAGEQLSSDFEEFSV